MRPIPTKLKSEIADDPFYKNCCICGAEGVQWHHNLIFAGRQVNEKFCILPACPQCHTDVHIHKEHFDWIMLNRATDLQLNFYSKVINYKHEKTRLNNKFGGAWEYPKQEEQ